MQKVIISTLLASVLILAGCSGVTKPYRFSCADELNLAWQELDLAKAEGFAGTVSYTKALSLISLAKAKQQVENFDGCYENAEKARFYITESRQGR